MKKILSIITAVTLCFSSFAAFNAGAAALAPVDSFTAENKTADSGNCGVSVKWSYSNGKLSFSGSGAMSSWETASATPWYKYSSQITSVEIEQGITNVGAASLANVQNLGSIYIPDSVTKIEFGAFDSCKSLRSIDLPAKVATIGRNAFRSCSSLTSVTIRNTNCYIVGGNDTICNSSTNGRSTFNGTISGYNNSTAQTYATECGYRFVSLGNAPASTTTTTKATTTTTKKTTTTTQTTTTTTKPTTTTTKVTTTTTRRTTTSTTTSKPVTTTTNVRPQPPENKDSFETVKDGMLTYRVYKDHAELEKCERFMWGELNIPSEKNGVPVTVICEGALRDRMMITGAVLPENVHTIAANAFSNSGCKKVTIYDPSCSIADNCGIKCQIAGYDGSTAQSYAQKKGLEFISMGPAPSHGPVSDLVPGDSNCDKFVDLADAVLIMQAYSNPNKYGLNGYDSAHITEKGAKNGDVDGGGNGITPKDAVAIQRYLLGVISEL